MNENYVSENFNNYLNKSMRNVLTYIENPQNEFEKLQNEIALESLADIKKIYKDDYGTNETYLSETTGRFEDRATYNVKFIQEKIKKFLIEINLNCYSYDYVLK